MSLKQAIAQIDDERAELVEKVLRKAGWSHHCDSPGCVWYWAREWNGQRWTHWTANSAYAMQCSSDIRAKLEGKSL